MDRKMYFCDDPWKMWEGLYERPTGLENDNLKPFLCKYAFEEDDFDEDNDQEWAHLKMKNRCPNLRTLMIQLFHQVRHSKGYDVDLDLRFMPMDLVFTPIRLDEDKKLYEVSVAGCHYTVGIMNDEMEEMGSSKRYEFISLEKCVLAPFIRMYLTFTAKETDACSRMEIDDEDEAEDEDRDGYAFKIVQSMVQQRYGDADFEHLHEWKFKRDDFDASAYLEEVVETRLQLLYF